MLGCRQIEFNYYTAVVFKLLSILLLVAHFQACGFWYLAYMKDFDSTTWVTHFGELQEGQVMHSWRPPCVFGAPSKPVPSRMGDKQAFRFPVICESMTRMHPIHPYVLAALQTAWDHYLSSLYWTYTTISTTGYGDLTPMNDDERFYTLCTMVWHWRLTFVHANSWQSVVAPGSPIQCVCRFCLRRRVRGSMG